MEGVGARLGRSSTRYGPATVFNGPVRRWNKKWVAISNPNPNTNHHHNAANTNTSNLLVFKWTPVAAKTKEAAASVAGGRTEETLKRKYRYIPISVIEYQKSEASAKSEDSKPSESDQSSQPSHADPTNMKPDMNDVPAEEFQASDQDQNPTERSGTNLDLSLGLNSEGEPKNDLKIGRRSEGGGRGKEANTGTNSQAENKRRKTVTTDLEMRM